MRAKAPLRAFVLSAGLAGLAGSLKVLVQGFETLGDAYWTMSGLVILMTLVGGMGTLTGPIGPVSSRYITARLRSCAGAVAVFGV